jgi:hypothetical protein
MRAGVGKSVAVDAGASREAQPGGPAGRHCIVSAAPSHRADCRQAVDKAVDNCPDSVDAVWTPEKQQVNEVSFSRRLVRDPHTRARARAINVDRQHGQTRPPSSHT